MSDITRKLLATATRDATDGLIEVERWKECWTTRHKGYWGSTGAEHIWTRKTSAKALLAKERDYCFEVETADGEGVTVWHCIYTTDREGSYCRYVFKTPRPREFYAQALGARSEAKTIAVDLRQGRPAVSVRL